MIVIIDYKMGNIGSILNMFKKIGKDVVVSSDIVCVEKADKLVLPGVGAFDAGMANLNKLGIISVLNKKVKEEKIPILGICLGMQLFGKKSEEGSASGLEWIDAQTIKFKFTDRQNDLRVPHMGWNNVLFKKNNLIFSGLNSDSRFYFVHSYHMVCKYSEDILAVTQYGFDFTSAVQKGNIIGVQFHPEKSHRYGMQLFKNFSEI